MKSGVYDVTLYWHDGGSLFLGTVAAMSAGEAQAVAMRQYVAQSKVNRLEIEDGGSCMAAKESMKYRILLDDAPVGATDWLPVAQAAWDRATRHRDAAQHGGEAVLIVDGQIVASVQPRTLEGHPWPVRGDHVTDLRDAAKAVIALARAAGVDAQALAQAMTDSGFPTTRARLKNVSTMEQGRRSATTPAELVAMCYAAVAVLKGEKTS